MQSCSDKRRITTDTGWPLDLSVRDGQDAGVTLGFDGSTNPATGSVFLSADDSSHLLAGLWYINLHTENFMDGEIRGQIFQISPPAVVPLPAAIWLMLSVVAGLDALWRQK